MTAPCPRCGEEPQASSVGTPIGTLYWLSCRCFGAHSGTPEGALEGWEIYAEAARPRPRTVQTVLPADAPMRNKAARVREALRGKGWRTTAQVLADSGARDGREAQSVLRALDRMVQYGEAERYPPKADGRRTSRDGIEWRLKGAGE